MSNHYSITITSTQNDLRPPLTFEVDLLDDLHEIVDRMRRMELVPDEETTAFALGLKLFAESWLRHRREPVFAELATAFPAFVTQLKARQAV